MAELYHKTPQLVNSSCVPVSTLYRLIAHQGVNGYVATSPRYATSEA